MNSIIKHTLIPEPVNNPTEDFADLHHGFDREIILIIQRIPKCKHKCPYRRDEVT